MQSVDLPSDLIDRADYEPVVVFERACLIQRGHFDWSEVARVERSAAAAWVATQPARKGGASGRIDPVPETTGIDARAPILRRRPLRPGNGSA